MRSIRDGQPDKRSRWSPIEVVSLANCRLFLPRGQSKRLTGLLRQVGMLSDRFGDAEGGSVVRPRICSLHDWERFCKQVAEKGSIPGNAGYCARIVELVLPHEEQLLRQITPGTEKIGKQHRHVRGTAPPCPKRAVLQSTCLLV